MKSSYISKFFPAVFFLVAGLFFASTLSAQVIRQWVKFYDDPVNSQNRPAAMVADNWGSVYVTGTGTMTSNSNDTLRHFITIKYSAGGFQDWVMRFVGDKHADEATAMAIDKNANVYVTGSSAGNGTQTDFMTIKYNTAGTMLWSVRFNGALNSFERPLDIKADNDGNVYVTGYTQTNTGDLDFATVKYNNAGVQQWVQYFNGPGNYTDVPFSLALDPVTSDVYVTGFTGWLKSSHDYVTIKYSSAGVQQWVRYYNGNSAANTLDEARRVAVDAQGNVYVGGNSVSSENIHGAVTIKYNAAGEQQWVQRFNGPGNAYAQLNDMTVDATGNVYIVGYVGYSAGDHPVMPCFTVKYNSAGTVQWTQYDNVNEASMGRGVALDDEGNVYVTGNGFKVGRRADSHFMTIKYNAQGELKWMEEYNPYFNLDGGACIAVNRYHDVFVFGDAIKNYGNANTNNDLVTIRYSQPKPLVVKASPDTTVYYGYGSNCVQLSAQISGGVTPYSLKWSSGGVNISSTWVCPLVTTVYTATAKDVNGFTATSQVTVKVVDVRCDTKNNKIVICHNGKELCLAANAVAAHLKHGDVLGSCIQSNTSAKKEKEAYKMEPAFAIYPNPVQNTSTVYYSVQDEAYVTITLVDANGKEMKTIVQGRKLPGSYTAVINANDLASGVYLCRMTVSSSGSQSAYVLKIAVSK